MIHPTIFEPLTPVLTQIMDEKWPQSPDRTWKIKGSTRADKGTIISVGLATHNTGPFLPLVTLSIHLIPYNCGAALVGDMKSLPPTTGLRGRPPLLGIGVVVATAVLWKCRYSMGLWTLNSNQRAAHRELVRVGWEAGMGCVNHNSKNYIRVYTARLGRLAACPERLFGRID
jgi:hypothetical protein